MNTSDEPVRWAGVLIIKNRRVLTLRENDKPFYLMPGGKLEPGETDEAAATREIMEELGVSVDIQSTFIEILETSKNTGQLIRFKLFTGQLAAEPDIHKLPGKTVAIAYINSHYAQEGLEIGNFLIKLLPELVKQNLID
jgi:8-oxo-dGTP pyrophosphatase MutT (NUDIX family)